MLDIKDDDRFERQGDDLIFDLPLSFSQVALGVDVTVPTPYGEESVRVAAGTQPETIIRLRGRGLPVLGASAQGRPDRAGARLDAGAAERASRSGCSGSWPSSRASRPKRSPGFWSKLKEALGA